MLDFINKAYDSVVETVNEACDFVAETASDVADYVAEVYNDVTDTLAPDVEDAIKVFKSVTCISIIIVWEGCKRLLKLAKRVIEWANKRGTTTPFVVGSVLSIATYLSGVYVFDIATGAIILSTAQITIGVFVWCTILSLIIPTIFDGADSIHIRGSLEVEA